MIRKTAEEDLPSIKALMDSGSPIPLDTSSSKC